MLKFTKVLVPKLFKASKVGLQYVYYIYRLVASSPCVYIDLWVLFPVAGSCWPEVDLAVSITVQFTQQDLNLFLGQLNSCVLSNHKKERISKTILLIIFFFFKYRN